MSTTQHQVMMESSLATLGRLELTPSPAAGGVNLGPRLSGGPPGKERSGQPALGTQPPSHLNGCVPLSHQVAGHKYGVDKVGILQHPDGTVLKQLQPPPRGPREMQFYSMVYSDDCCDPCLLDLQDHLPTYYGTWSSPDSPNDLYLKLEDVTRGFIKPCIMDVKLGQRSYDPFASQEKREQQIRKYPLMEEIGFLVLGMRVYKVGSDSFDSYDQHYGRGLVKDTIKDGLSQFFHNGLSLRRDAVSASILKVRRILGWFQSQRQLAFYASSLLFVYEGLPSSSSSSSSFSSTSPAPPLCTPVNGPPSDKTSVTSSGTDANVGGGGEGKKRQEMRQEAAGQEEEVAEYNNNNNIRVAVPLDYSLATMYANHRKGSGNHHHHHHHHHHCTRGHIHDNGDATMTITTATKDDVTAANKEDNSPWKRDEPQQPNGNGIKLEEEDGETEEEEEEERKKVSEGGMRDKSEEQRERGNGGEGEVEVRMIDFAHVFPSDSHDHGYIYGLKHLLTVLEEILQDSS